MKTEKQKWIDSLIDTLIVILGPIIAGAFFAGFLIWLWILFTT